MKVRYQPHAFAALTPGKKTYGINWIDDWLGPIFSLGAVEKREIL
jgi:hypothetical protein